MGKKSTDDVTKSYILDVLRKRDKFEAAKREYDKAKEALTRRMKNTKQNRIDTPWYNINLKYYHDIDEDLFKEEFPDMYYVALKCEFKPELAFQEFPRSLVMQAFRSCSKGGVHRVQIQTRKDKNTRKKLRRKSKPAKANTKRARAPYRLKANR